MKRFLLLLMVSITGSGAFAQDYLWAKSIGGTTIDIGLSIAVDASANVYTTGLFSGTADFDPGVGISNLTSAGGSDIFIIKTDASGNFLWAKSIGGTGDDVAKSITVAAGNIYFTGAFFGGADFDPGAAVYNITSVGNLDIFILKLNTDGNFAWAKNIGGTTNDTGYSIAVDVSGNVYATGSYSSTADFDPSAGVVNLTSLKAGDDIFVVKLSAAGNFLWAKSAGSASGDYGYSIAVDAGGNAYITGSFTNDANFNPYVGGAPGTSFYTSFGATDIFILKLETTGTFVWAKRMGSVGGDIAFSIAVDAAQNVYTTGQFTGIVDFDPGAGTASLNSAGTNTDVFVCKLNVDGNFIWAKNMGGTNGDIGFSIAVDAAQNVYTTGGFAGTSDFDPNDGIFNLTSAGGSDIFISKLNAAGSFVSAKSMGGTSDNEIGMSLALDVSGNIYSTGSYIGTADFNSTDEVYNLTSNGASDIYISKLGLINLPVSLLNFDVAKNNTDALLTWKTATESNTNKFEIERSSDGIIYHKTGEIKAAGNSATMRAYHFTDKNIASTLPGQTWYYRLKQIDADGRFTYSPIRTISFNIGVTVSIYPNPANNVITIQAGNGEVGLNYSVTDAAGRLLINRKLNQPTTTINISHLKTGIYFIQVGAMIKESIKVIKQ